MSLFLQLLTQWNGGIRRGSQIKLANELGISHTKISDWIANRQKPGEENIQKMAALFQINPEKLRKIFKMKNPKIPPVVIAEPVEYVPMLGQACASRFKCIICEQEPELFLPIRRDNAGDYALQVVGDCMDPAIKDGEYVIIRPTADVKEGEIVLARMEDECTIKRLFFKKPNILCLVPDNRKYEIIYGTLTDIRIMGKIIHVHRPAKRITKRPEFLDEE